MLIATSEAAKLQIMVTEVERAVSNFPFFKGVNYDGFGNIIPEMLYQYLFKGESLRSIERMVIGSDNMDGWFSKTILNYIGVSTDPTSHTKGIFKDQEINEVIAAFLKQGSEEALRISYYLSLYRG
ncbi:MAG: hypothetical protein HUJ54_12285 [Erysipelotrichaceae bacterium]|nr:hypothetical protein [Erysipelotrichaceae bacterium]